MNSKNENSIDIDDPPPIHHYQLMKMKLWLIQLKITQINIYIFLIHLYLKFLNLMKIHVL